MTLNWAVENPEKVGAFAGIYPVCNIASYSGVAKAAPAYGLTPEELQSELAEHNPTDRLAPLVKNRIPLFAISATQQVSGKRNRFCFPRFC